MTTVRKQIDEISPMSEERAKEIETMSDQEIDYSDIPPLDTEFFQKAKLVTRISKIKKKLRLHHP